MSQQTSWLVSVAFKPSFRMLAAMAVAIAAGVPSAWGSIYTGANNGLWSVGGNWSAGVPGPADTAEFADNVTPATRTVLDLNTAIGQLSFTGAFNQIGAASGVANFTLTINSGLTNTANNNTTFTQIKTITLGSNQTWSLSGTSTGDVTTAAGGMVMQGAASDQFTLDLNGNTLTKTGTGRISFGSTNVNAGNIDITAGEMRFSAGANQPIAISGAGTISVGASAALLLGSSGASGVADVTIVDKTIQMNGGGSLGTAALLNYGSGTGAAVGFAQTIAANMTFSGFSTFQIDDQATNATNRSWDFSGDWSGNGTITLTAKTTSQSATHNTPTILSGDNSGLTGYVNNAQALSTTRGVNFGSATAGSASAEWGLSHANAIYRLNGNSVNLGALSGTAGTLVNGHASTAATATLGGKGINTSFDGVIANGGVAALKLVKTGAAVQTFNNANTYTGSTTINGGTLALGAAGSFANSPLIIVGDTASSGTVLDLTAKSAFTFSASQTVGGKGLIDIGAGKTVTFDGTVSPGNSIETLSLLGDAAFGNASILSIEIDESDSNIVDVLAITGDLDVASGAAVVFNVTGGLTLSQYVFGTYTGSLTGAFASATVPAGYVLEQGSGQLKLTLIPEPSSLALLLFGALGYLAMFRKRNG